jgi:hemerythrin-like domain-containing protein
MHSGDERRAFLTIAGAGVLLAACQKGQAGDAVPSPSSAGARVAPTSSAGAGPKDESEEDVGATEDLMREHGVIRRVLVVYRETATRLRAKAGSVPVDALQKAAKLIRTFGEDYHEKQLEEAHIFPALKNAGGAAAAHIDTLIAQHPMGAAIAEPLARTLESFARMYEEHAALEDTVVFPAWKKALSPKQLDEMGDLFEDIEHKTFGKDGFDDAVEQIAAIEKSLGIDLAALMAPAPPSR